MKSLYKCVSIIHKDIYNISKVVLATTLFTFISSSAYAQESDDTYYDSFYKEYYNSFPNNKPGKKTTSKKEDNKNDSKLSLNSKKDKSKKNSKSKTDENKTTYKLPDGWETMYYNEAMKYWEYDTNGFTLEAGYQRGVSQFQFVMDVGSILNWGNMQTNQLKIAAEKDFKISGKQYQFKFEYENGTTSSEYTFDDDLWNELHIYSAGKGAGKTSNLKFSIGMRNFFRAYGWNITPYVGYQMKRANLRMFDHGQPATYYFDCERSLDSGNYIEDDYGNGYCKINLQVETLEGETIDEIYVLAGSLIPEGEFDLYGSSLYKNPTDDQYYFDLDYIVPFEDLMSVFGGYSFVNAMTGDTHLYDVTWNGPYAGVDIEKVMSIRESLKFRFELFYPFYEANGKWPNRTEWKNFVDAGGTSFGYLFSAIYTMKLLPKFGIYGAFTYEGIHSSNMDTTINFSDGTVENFPKSIKTADWNYWSFEVGAKYTF